MPAQIKWERPRSTDRKGRALCLKCDKHFMSEDRIAIRICPTCKGGTAWKGSRESDALLPPSGSIMSIPTYAQAGIKKPRRSPSFGGARNKRKKA
jgi:hypothetical protein